MFFPSIFWPFLCQVIIISTTSLQGEGDTSRATDPESALSPKKKKKGLRTPSFLKKKKKDKKEKDEKKKEKTPA